MQIIFWRCFVARFLGLSVLCVLTASAYADCVGGARYYPFVVETGNGTVIDARTGLEWQLCSSGQRWIAGTTNCSGEANKYPWHEVARVQLDKGWRIPSKDELQGLANAGCTAPAVAPLLNKSGAPLYWSSSATDYPQHAWAMSFANGKVVSGDKKHALAVRVVRDQALMGVLLASEREKLVQKLQAMTPEARVSFLGLSAIEGQDKTERLGFYIGNKADLAKVSTQLTWDQQVNERLQKFVRQWLDVGTRLSPPPVPQLPAELTLKQESWETDGEFNKRAALAQVERQTEVEKIQTQFRQQVETYNRAVNDVQSVYAARRSLAQSSTFRMGLTRAILNETLASLNVASVDLNRETNTLYINARAGTDDVIGQYAFNEVPASLRKQLLQEGTQVRLTPIFTVDDNGGFAISQISIKEGGATLIGNAVQGVEKGGGINRVAKIDLGSSTQLAMIASLQKQNPNLVDQFEVGKVTFRDGSTGLVKFEDDLIPLIAALKPAPENNKIWLFAIGAEKYKYTDSIQFARRSAEAFVATTQKSLGIPKGHVFALYDDEATGGSIKGRLKQMLTQGVQEGDTVIFYYNGHGVPVPSDDNLAYLMPTDTVPDFVADDKEFRLNNLYKTLQDSKAGKVIVLLDSCFTGQTDGKSVFKGDKAATRLAPKKVQIDDNKVAVLTAGNDRQYASAYVEKGHRLFTYFVVKELLNQRRTVQELHQAVAVDVRDQSRKNGPQGWQDPQLDGNEKMHF